MHIVPLTLAAIMVQPSTETIEFISLKTAFPSQNVNMATIYSLGSSDINLLPQPTLHILAAGTVLKVRMRLAFTPGGGSNVNTREVLSRFTGT